ncbi:MAG: hypothetical protein QM479_06140 [Pseudomonadota bacterium]
MKNLQLCDKEIATILGVELDLVKRLTTKSGIQAQEKMSEDELHLLYL